MSSNGLMATVSGSRGLRGRDGSRSRLSPCHTTHTKLKASKNRRQNRRDRTLSEESPVGLASFTFSFAWALFIVFERIILKLPWPLKQFLLRQFPDEFAAQRAVLRSQTHYR